MARSLNRRLFRIAAVALSVSLLGACSMFSAKDPRFEPAPLVDFEAGAAAQIRWSTSIGKGAGFGFIPAVSGDRVYAATPSGQLSQIDLQSGRVLWTKNVAKRLSAGVGADGTTVAVASQDGSVLAFDNTGNELWQVKASSEVNVPPAVGHGVVVVRSSDYRIQAFDVRSGELLWSLQRPGPALALKTNVKMEIVDGLVVAGMPNGRMMLIDAASGAVQWEGVVSQSRGATDLERINDVVGGPVIVGPLLCGSSYQGRVVCFDLSDGGVPVWQNDFSTTTGITTDGRLVFGSNQRDVVTAFALEEGTVVWSQDALRNRKLSGPAVIHNQVAVGDYQGYVHFLSRSDGRLLGRVGVGSGAIVSPLVSTPFGVLVQSGNGNLVLVDVN
ncbi:MAG TPA: outer membrane protein assembly factor BamB [Paenalcaligenes hominis]|uniref:Outer membrane protein assembly factor BamB n=2 Tax=Paenalcaligenes hominis TaxID=643674 RepID=A0A9D2VH84_9BURK|nr:outer membrane protein assembly factor BamB [Paenalcaligenes hominis]NJB64042.1 outer membrane protein assembly factor BamB [Paenalcaligenes hominis]GGE62656.1 outer membrane protein assembly factor BamB [Paenalcaligenes hominis]HJH24509.1 outer membrane protein assembly factor BamB [Paenalcaligenes hominis]